MKFTLTCRDRGGTRTWPEPYEKDVVTTAVEAQEWAEKTIRQFNATLQRGEVARELVSVALDESTTDAKKDHAWGKTNLVTKLGRGGSWDEYTCLECGVTGKRYMLGSPIAPDRKYRARVYERCDTALAHLAKRAARPSAAVTDGSDPDGS